MMPGGGLGIVGRRVAAVAIVAALVGAAPCIDRLLNTFRGGGSADTHVYEGVSLARSSNPFDALESIEHSLDGFSSTLPEGFAGEIGVLDGASEVAVSEDGAVVGYRVAGTADEVHRKIGESMAVKGWLETDLGSIRGATYTKKEGAYRWILVTCTQAGGLTSVVIRCPRM